MLHQQQRFAQSWLCWGILSILFGDMSRGEIVLKVFTVQTSSGLSYPVWCGTDSASTLANLWHDHWRQAVIIGDSNTMILFGKRLAEVLKDKTDKVIQLSFPAGEDNKTRATKEALEDKMFSEGIDRSACVVAVGGGIVLDVAGFVAATYMRGLDHINIATGLLAQVDVAIGGKTVVNTEHGKNLVGAFHQPRAALLDTSALKTLPDPEIQNGLAELVKHAVVWDAELFSLLEQWAQGPRETRGVIIQDLLVRSAKIKAEVVAQDEREAGLRAVLNFGHTVAHAIEGVSDYQVPHGMAVAIGMNVEGQIARRLCGFPSEHLERLQDLLRTLNLPIATNYSFSDARPFFKLDKKTRAGVVHCSLPKKFGRIVKQRFSITYSCKI